MSRAPSLFALDGRVALVTGASRGLGLEIARALAECGARVVVNGTERDRAEAAATGLRDEGLDAEAAAFNVTNENATASAIDALAARYGRLDIVVNNVGARLRRPLAEIETADLRRMLDVNLVTAYGISRRAAAAMASNGYGRIINIGSVASERGRADNLAYIVAKGGLGALTRALAAEFAPMGITCNTLLPGTFRTETNAAAFAQPGMDGWFAARILLARPGEPREIAGAATFLASPAASYVTGVSLPVDGGYLACG